MLKGLWRASAPSTAMAAVVAIGIAAGPAVAQDRFPADQFGNVNLRFNQSLGGNDDFIRAQQNAAFEPLADFNENEPFRQRSRPVGRLQMLIEDEDGSTGTGTCTATLVGRDLALTNYHCIPGLSGTVHKALLHLGYLRQDQNDVDAYSVDPKPVAASHDLDFALVRVSGHPGDTYGFVDLTPVRVVPNQSLFIYHHPAGLPLRLSRFRCKAYAGDAYIGSEFRHRCDTLGGSSGSLVLSTEFQVVALHHSGGLTGDSGSSFNTATAMDAVYERIAPYLDQPAAAVARQHPMPLTPPEEPEPVSLPVASEPAPAAAPSGRLARVPERIGNGFLNVRSGPGVSNPVIGSIPAGASGVVVDEAACRQAPDGRTQKPWCPVNWRGLQGWASSSGLILPPVATTPASDDQPFVYARIFDETPDYKLNVRTGAGLDHLVVGAIPAGTEQVAVFAETCRQSDDGRTRKPWCRVRWNGLDGWASTSGLILPQDAAGAATDDQPFVYARIPDEVSDFKLNVRAGAGISHPVIGAIPGGAERVVVLVETCRQSDDGRTRKPWCQVRWNGLEGWASTSGLQQ